MSEAGRAALGRLNQFVEGGFPYRGNSDAPDLRGDLKTILPLVRLNDKGRGK